MQHAEVREALELAAVEPAGLDRLTGGDTPQAAAIAGHLAGCSTCLEELNRLRRSSALLREVIAVEPPAELRDRTLAFVRELGIPRTAPGTGAPAVVPTVPAPSTAIPVETPEPASVIALGRARQRRSIVRPLGWVVSIAAAVVLSVAATSLILVPRTDDDGAALAKVAGWTVDIAAAPDARRVLLASAGGGMGKVHGELSFAPSSMDLVVVARGLPAAPAGKEYRCWLEAADGTRTKIGKMAVAYDVFFWVGDVPALTNVAPGTKFGVSLASLDAGSPGAPVVDQPLLIGQL